MSLDIVEDPGPEVFETSDVESLEDITSQAIETRLPEHENALEISEEGFSASSVRERFESYAILEPQSINFLGSVTKRGLGESGIPVVRWAETKEQKLSRIEQEVIELMEGEAEERLRVDKILKSLHSITQNNGENGYYNQKMKEALELLASSETKITQLVGASFQANLEDITIQNRKNSGSRQIMGEITELEARISKIEASVGSVDDISQKNLRVHINDLERKVNVVLDPNHALEPAIHKVTKLSKSLENLLANERKVDLHLGDRAGTTGMKSADTPFEMKVNRIYSKLPQIETANEQLPFLINRLRSLHETHSSLATSVAVTGSVDQTLHALQQDMQDWQKNLQEISECLDTREANFATNSALVDRKLRLMEKKLANLQPN